ncbi:MAG: nucleotide exchange factor GrpE [Coriobacteriia bacterium]|nr:nucleotide exchange factor GrpE [Coriobacteriia bacterium]
MTSKKTDKHTSEANTEAAASAAASAASTEQDTPVFDDQSEVEALLAQMEEFRDKALRAQAEFENSKKRMQTQQATALLRASERVVTALIPAMDDIEFAVAHAQESGNDMLEGLQAIQAKLVAVFATEQVEIINPLGQTFDHNTAQAVQMIEDDNAPDQSVSQVLQKGYVMGKDSDNPRVLRPAMVVVSTNTNS